MDPIDLGKITARLREVSRSFGAAPVSINIRARPVAEDPIEVELERGIEVTLDAVTSKGGVLEYRGYQVLLYIDDQGWNIDVVLEDGSRGKKYHVAECRTLREMRAKGRFDRYVATNKLDGVFKVFGTSKQERTHRDGEAQLVVCKNCLKFLNYEGYDSDHNYAAFRNFTLAAFFEKYSTNFVQTPREFKKPREMRGGYTQDWAEVSERVRREAKYRCESCRVDLSDHVWLCHVHHKHGVKHDNSRANLAVLCAACHRTQPDHAHLHIKKQDQDTLQRLRRNQGVLEQVDDWNEVFEYADPAYDGVLKLLKSKGAAAPQIGFDLQDGPRVVGMLEVAWPEARMGLQMSESDLAEVPAAWRLMQVADVLREPDGLLRELAGQHSGGNAIQGLADDDLPF